MERAEIISWLSEKNPASLEQLRKQADATRRNAVGDDVHLRALIEISNYCTNSCHYCGLRAANRYLPRYRMDSDEILDTVSAAVDMNFKTVVLQAGNDPFHTASWVSNLIRRIKSYFDVAIALSFGERPYGDYAAWRDAGAERYLLRFETSDKSLFASMHDIAAPDFPSVHPRLQRLAWLHELGYEVGGGMMVGLPGQNYETLADDILAFRELNLDMIGIGPFIAHPDTPLASNEAEIGDSIQVPCTIDMALKVVALARLVCPAANIPATTAIEALSTPQERLSFINWGANVLMPDVTPERYRRLYDIYPGKTIIAEYTKSTHEELLRSLSKMGRRVGRDIGSARNRLPE